MRRVLIWATGLAVIWCIWWAGASFFLRSVVDDWMDQRRAEGWQAEASAITGGGFPVTLVVRLQDPSFADPGTGAAISADWLAIESAAWWPGDVRVRLPDTPMALATPDGRRVLTAADAELRLALSPRDLLPINTLAATASGWGITDGRGTVFSADSFTLSMQQGEAPTDYRFDIEAHKATPGDVLRDALRIPADWPVAFDTLSGRMDVTFDRPWDLRALEERRPQPRAIKLHKAEIAWGALRLNLALDLTVDAQGIADGTVTLQARNWRDMLAVAETSGLLHPSLIGQATTVLQSLAGLSGNPNTIDVDLQISNGTLMLGFLPLAPTPRVYLR